MSNTVIFQYLQGSNQTLTIPDGYSNQVLIYAWGAGGGDGSGASGAGGGYVAGVATINSGDTISVSIGSSGGIASGSAGGAPGFGNNPTIVFDGGTGANGSDPEDNDAGGSGGGGGASSILVNNIPIIVAAGGGGGGGYGEDGTGGATVGTPGGTAAKVNTLPRGKNGTTSGAGGSGGGGGGYPYGGAAGIAYGDDGPGGEGGYGGQNYANTSVVTDSVLASGSGVAPGGLTSDFYPKAKRGYAGYDGAVIIVFQKLFSAWIKDTTWKSANNAWVKVKGSWKEITQGWIKRDGVWKSVTTPISLNPIKSSTVPVYAVHVNLVIAANTTSYDLSTYLEGSGYYPGHSVVTLTVNNGVTVGSNDVLTPAITISGLTAGDQFTLTNNGTIIGRGGDGGAGGSYVVTGGGGTINNKVGMGYNSYNQNNKGTATSSTGTTTSVPGRRGFDGGMALKALFQTTLINNGTIAGGGGGGGGGGGNSGGVGGGGAGYLVGVGANNGTSTTGGAGSAYGGAGGARGQAGTAGTNDSNAGGTGGLPGVSIVNSSIVTIKTAGTIIGPIA